MEAIYGAIIAYAIATVGITLTGLLLMALHTILDINDEYERNLFKRLAKWAIIWPILIVSINKELNIRNKEMKTIYN